MSTYPPRNLWLVVLIGLCISHTHAQTYTWTTIAGTAGVSGSMDGTNSGALFNFPSGIARDAGGALYVTDTQNNTIRKLTASGGDWIVTTLAGMPKQRGSVDGTNEVARFNRPNGIAVGNDEALLIADTSNYTVRRLTPLGTNWTTKTIAGSPGTSGSSDGNGAAASFLLPRGICASSTGAIVADTGNHSVRTLTPGDTDWVVQTISGGVPDFIDGLLAEAAFNSPLALTMNSDGGVYAADYGNHAIRFLFSLTGDGLVTTIAGDGTGGSVDGTGTNAQFNLPKGVALDSAGNLYVTEEGNHTVRRLSFAGGEWQVTTIGGLATQPGSADGAGTEARFTKPWGIVAEPSGILYVVDYGNHTIRKGVPSSGAPAQLAFVMNPAGLTLNWDSSLTNYALEVNTDLMRGSWTSLQSEVTLQSPSFTYTVTNFIPQTGFYRLKRL